MPYKRAGSKYWWIRVEGVRRSSGTANKQDAKALEDSLNAQAWRNEKLGIKAPKSFPDMCVRWARENGGKATFEDDRRAIRWWHQFYGPVQDIRGITRETTDTIIQKHRPVTVEASPANNTANHYVAYLAAMLNAACKEWDWIERAPSFRYYPITDGRERWLTVAEWRTLESKLPDYLRRPLTFALATGLRRGKVIGKNGLQWSQVDLGNRSLTFKGFDNKRGNTIPLNDTAMGVLKEIRSKPHHLTAVFSFQRPSGIEPLVKGDQGLTTALKAAGLVGGAGEDACFHTLRHTWNSWLAQEGVAKDIRNRLGGWASKEETVDRYTHLSLDWLRPFAGVIDTVLTRERIIGPLRHRAGGVEKVTQERIHYPATWS